MAEPSKPAAGAEEGAARFGWKKEKLLRLLIVAGLLGIGLIFLSSVFKKPEAAVNLPNEDEFTVRTISVEEYRQQLCDELGNMVASMKGSGKTKVMLTLDGTVRDLYASDNDIQQRESSRKNSADENADKQSSEKRSLITLRGKDGSEQAVRVGQLLPVVRGVLVVCEGGDDENVQKRITEAVSAALNLSSSHICVTKGDF